MQAFQYVPCGDCQRIATAWNQAYRSPYQTTMPVYYADGQDGVCSKHRGERRQMREVAAVWRSPLPEGQE